MIPAEEAKKKLIEGNQKYLDAKAGIGDVSRAIRLKTAKEGQHPYAIVITCSDSRVVPESIFSAGIGELFTIRLAENVIDDHQLGSIEYAVEHLGTNLVVVLGHTGCGAVEAAIHHDPSGFIKYITDEIRLAIGEETDPYRASCLNVAHSVNQISHALDIDHLRHGNDPAVIGAIYHIDDGHVEFLHD
jgi:carbonic anhydrase